MLNSKGIQWLLKDKPATGGLILISLFVITAILAPILSPYDPVEMDLPNRLRGISREHWMGTDGFGRDVLSRIIYGTRLSLTTAFAVTVLITSIGVIVGGVAGYFGGLVDELLMRVVDILLAFPKIILALAIVAVLGPSLRNLVMALALTGWVSYSRVIRGLVLSFREKEFIQAAKAIGCGDPRILAHHIIPNVMAPVIVLATLDMGHVILSISALSFLGLGAQPPTPEWGAMLNEGRPFMQSAPHLMIFPGLMIMLTVLAFNLLGDGLRDALDPYYVRESVIYEQGKSDVPYQALR
ncbi:MAG TPA: ABC transporter permease [Caldilineae bacterium]|nr:ABC transporter permease [Caldilineae bacterium]